MLSVALQWRLNERFTSELGAFPDEPAHYVTGVMILEYVRTRLGASPLEFAAQFYDSYPKVALGNWPPGFYLLQLPWLMGIGDTPSRLLVGMAVLAGLTAFMLARLASRCLPEWIAVSAAVLWLMSPLSLALSGSVMTEVPLAFMCLLSIQAWLYFSEQPSATRAGVFGLAVGLAILVKASAAGVAAVIATGVREHAARTRWQAGLGLGTALLIGGPWTIYFREQSRAGWMFAGPTLKFTLPAAAFYLGRAPVAFGWVATAGLVLWCVRLARAQTLLVERAAGMSVAALLLISVTVPAGFEERHLLPALAPVLLLAASGYWQTVRRSVGPANAPRLMAFVVLVALLEYVSAWQQPMRRVMGYRVLAEAAVSVCARPCTLLVASDSEGEGALVAEVLARRSLGGVSVVRASKVLASSDWAGRGYRPVVHSTGDVLRVLAEHSVDLIVLDDVAVSKVDGRLLAATIEERRYRRLKASAVLRTVSTPFGGTRRGHATLYTLAGSPLQW